MGRKASDICAILMWTLALMAFVCNDTTGGFLCFLTGMMVLVMQEIREISLKLDSLIDFFKGGTK